MKYTDEMGEVLNRLLQKNLDAEKGFRNAADDVKDEQLKSFFKEVAQQRYDFAHELRTEIRNFGQPPIEGSSISADAHRTWMNIRSGLASNSSEAVVLQEAKRGEETAEMEYRDMLKEHNFPPATESVLIKQRDAFKQTIKKIEALEGDYR